uniref:alpha-1,2-Mannosidase n=1 Tax=Steinernema glaseri TaxID=37863 RepID=A0A1I7XZM9_9BILA
MGLEDEYNAAREFIRDNWTISKATSTLSVFETNIRFLGGMLSLYALTKEMFYVEKAKEIADTLLPAFDTPSGIPKSNLNPVTKYVSNYGWAAGGSSILSEFGSLHLEFAYLSNVTGNKIYYEKVKKVRDVLDAVEKPDGLYSNYMSPETGKWTQMHMSLGALGDSFYEYLIKSWLQTGKKDEQAKRMYFDVSDAIQKKNTYKIKRSGPYSSFPMKTSTIPCFMLNQRLVDYGPLWSSSNRMCPKWTSERSTPETFRRYFHPAPIRSIENCTVETPNRLISFHSPHIISVHFLRASINRLASLTPPHESGWNRRRHRRQIPVPSSHGTPFAPIGGSGGSSPVPHAIRLRDALSITFALRHHSSPPPLFSASPKEPRHPPDRYL